MVVKVNRNIKRIYVWFGPIEFEFVVVQLILFGLQDDLNENSIVDSWMKNNPNLREFG